MIFFILAFILPFAVYLKTTGQVFSVLNIGLANTLDNLEFVFVIQKFGIAHPTGYPLYTMIGKLFSLIPIRDISFRVNLVSAFFGAATSAVVYLILNPLTLALSPEGRGKGEGDTFPIGSRTVPALVAALALAFSAVFWSQSIIPEVVTLQTFLMSLFFLFILKWQRTARCNMLYFAAFVLGLGFSNHMTTALLIPSFLYSITLGSPRRVSIKELGIISLLLILSGLLPYLYIPIRLSDPNVFMNPMNQAAGIETGSLRWYKWFLTAEAFRGLMFGFPIGMVPDRIVFFWGWFLRNFTPAGASLIAIGLCWGILYKRKETLGVIIALLGYTIFFINYKVSDQALFFIFIYAIAAIFLGLGVFAIGSLFPKRLALLSLAFIILPASLLFQNYKLNDRSRDAFSDEFAVALLKSVKPNSVIYAANSAYGIGLMYYQFTWDAKGGAKVFSINSMGEEYWKKAIADSVSDRKTHTYFFPAGWMPAWIHGSYRLVPVTLNFHHPTIDQDFLVEVAPKENAKPFKEKIKLDISKIKGSYFSDGLEVLGYTIAPHPDAILVDKVFTISLFLRKTAKDAAFSDKIEFGFLDDEGKPLQYEEHGFVAVYFLPLEDISSWRVGEVMEVQYDLILPVFSPSGEYTLALKPKEAPPQATVLLGGVLIKK